MSGGSVEIQEIEDQHHILRYCSHQHFVSGVISHSAFAYRKGEGYVSVNWMEYFSHIESADEQAKKIFEAVNNKLKIKDSGRFVKLKVGKVRSIPIPGVEVKHYPQKDDPSHSGILYEECEEKEKLKITLDLAHMINSDSDVFKVEQLRPRGE